MPNSITNEIAISTTLTAAADVVESLSMRENTNTDATSVLKGRLPLISTIAPNSPTARPNASATPARIAGRSAGRTIRRNV